MFYHGVHTKRTTKDVAFQLLYFIRRNDSAYFYTHFSVARSVLSSVCHARAIYLNLSTDLNMPFDKCTSLVGSINTLRQMKSPSLTGEKDWRIENPAETCNWFQLTKKMIYYSPDGSIDRRFQLLRNYSGPCFFHYTHVWWALLSQHFFWSVGSYAELVFV